MQTVSDVMTREVRFVSPGATLESAAQLMEELDVGVLPVCDGERLVGMVTDRDIAVRAVAGGKAPGETPVNDVMSKDVQWVFEDQDIDEVMIQMADSQIRRVPVVSHDESHRLVGIVSLGDVATKSANGQKTDVEDVVEAVSTPSRPANAPSISASDVGGQSGAGGAGEAAAGAGRGRMAGVDIPHAGQNQTGIAGASGDPKKTHAPGGEDPKAKTADVRKTFGVSGQDLQGDGLPPR